MAPGCRRRESNGIWKKASPLPPHLSILRSFQFRARVLRCYRTLGWRKKKCWCCCFSSCSSPSSSSTLRWIEIEALIGREAQEPSSPPPPPPSPYQYKDVTGLANPPLFPFPRHAAAAAADKVFSSSASQPRSGAGGKKVGDDGGNDDDDDDAPKDKKRGEEKFPSFSVLFFPHSLSQWENYPLYFSLGRTEEGNPLFRWGRREGDSEWGPSAQVWEWRSH